MLKYHMRVESTKVLGFGERCALWVSGCSKEPPCKGCIIADKRNTPPKTAEETSVAQWILNCKSAEGITVSGGEPFDQAESLSDILEEVKKNRPSFNIIVYTGKIYELLKAESEKDSAKSRLLALTDILIDGPYIEELNDNVPYRGSSNQRVLVLNPDYQSKAADYYTEAPGRKIEFSISDGESIMVGVPSKTQAESWKTMISGK